MISIHPDLVEVIRDPYIRMKYIVIHLGVLILKVFTLNH